MGEAERNERPSARDKIAAELTAARRADVRRQAGLTSLVVAAVIAVVVGLIVFKATDRQPAAAAPAKAKSISTVASDIASVPATTLNAVGKGSASSLIPLSGQPPLTLDGKPEMVYLGAEYCPYCAAERWAMAVALSRFGTFSGLHFIHSSSTDVYPDTPTLSFYKSSYASRYLAFTPVEWYSETPDPAGYRVLQQPTPAELRLISKYDAPPNVPSAESGAFPFIDIGNRYLDIGAQYAPSVLAGLTWSQVAAALSSASSSVARDIDGAANTITAALCKITGGKPGNVCTASGVTAADGAL
jgi:thiol-disulfide isomerase/thioredoxin